MLPQVTLEVLSFHAIAPLDEAVKLSRQRVPSAASLQLHSFQFDDFSLEDTDTLKVNRTVTVIYYYDCDCDPAGLPSDVYRS